MQWETSIKVSNNCPSILHYLDICQTQRSRNCNPVITYRRSSLEAGLHSTVVSESEFLMCKIIRNDCFLKVRGIESARTVRSEKMSHGWLLLRARDSIGNWATENLRRDMSGFLMGMVMAVTSVVRMHRGLRTYLDCDQYARSQSLTKHACHIPR